MNPRTLPGNYADFILLKMWKEITLLRKLYWDLFKFDRKMLYSYIHICNSLNTTYVLNCRSKPFKVRCRFHSFRIVDTRRCCSRNFNSHLHCYDNSYYFYWHIKDYIFLSHHPTSGNFCENSEAFYRLLVTF